MPGQSPSGACGFSSVNSTARNQLRIIGGRWRSRRLAFPDVPGLRPTPDRVRETVFNWLQEVIAGARCLDLFAGSGALGFEAASRGAGEVVLVDREHKVVERLRENARLLGATSVQVVQTDALRYLNEKPAQPFDIVFLDPPFGHNVLAPACRALEANGWLRDQARVYMEAEKILNISDIPANWRILRSKIAGQVGYHLAVRHAAESALGNVGDDS